MKVTKHKSSKKCSILSVLALVSDTESERGNINILYRKWIVTGNEKNVEDGGGGQVAGQQAACVRQHRLGVHQGQHEEGDGPHSMKDLKDENHQKPS